MNAETLSALQKSISKWERNTMAEYPDQVRVGVLDCPLCVLFHSSYCHGCPVAVRTGEPFCEDTPFEGAATAVVRWQRRPDYVSLRDLFHEASMKEVEFLRSLLLTTANPQETSS